MISDKLINAILSGQEPPEQNCRMLIDAANAAGGHDNITAVVMEGR